MRTMWKRTIGVAAVAAAITAGGAGLAVADNVTPDGDTTLAGNNILYNDPASPGQLACDSRGTAVTGSIDVVYNGSAHFSPGELVDVTLTSPDSGITVSASTTTHVPAVWNTNGQTFGIPISTTTATSVAQGTQSVGVHLVGHLSGYSPNDKTYDVTVGTTCTVDNGGGGGTGGSNTAPTVAFTNPPTSADEGSTKTFNFTINDPDVSDTQSYVTGSPDCGTGNTLSGTPTITNTGGSFSCTFVDGVVPAVASTVSVQVNDGTDDSNLATTDVTVNNVNPTVAAPTFSVTQVNCRTQLSLTGISFSDPGVNDAPWAVDINWGDGSSDTTFNATAQGAQTDQTHTYNAPGTYTASVTVTDKDGGANAATDSSNQVVVKQVYNTTFLQPFDGSSPSRLITNTMKNGRVVPVKASIFDVCTNAWVPSTANVTIRVSAASANPPASDPVESYADAGSSSGGTNLFRWTADSTFQAGGFWIYNLDSKALGLVIGTTYRIDICVDGHLATGSTWALLAPVK